MPTEVVDGMAGTPLSSHFGTSHRMLRHVLLSLFIWHSTLLLCRSHCSARVDAVVVAEIVESYVIHRVKSSPGNSFVNTIASTVDRIVLEFHDCSSTESIIALEITSKCRDSRHQDNHLVLFAVSGRTNDTLYDSTCDLIFDRFLLVASGCDEELVLDVDEVLAVLDHLNIRVRD